MTKFIPVATVERVSSGNWVRGIDLSIDNS